MQTFSGKRLKAWGPLQDFQLKMGLTQAESEVEEGKIKRISGMWIPILSMLIALGALVTSSFLQNKTISTQVEVKKYEMAFNPKQERYALFMKAIIEAFEAAWLGDPGSLIVKLDQGEIKYFGLEPFMNERDRNAILGQFQQFSAMCSELVKEPHQSSKREGFRDSYQWYKKYFHDELHRSLFGSSAQ
jgi:hypothetical protein